MTLYIISIFICFFSVMAAQYSWYNKITLKDVILSALLSAIPGLNAFFIIIFLSISLATLADLTKDKLNKLDDVVLYKKKEKHENDKI